jgi:ABC-type glycerol-3-phosphate transport system permease component
MLALPASSGSGRASRGVFSFVRQEPVITSALLTIVPLIITLLGLRRHWQAGLSPGTVKG